MKSINQHLDAAAISYGYSCFADVLLPHLVCVMDAAVKADNEETKNFIASVTASKK